MLIKPWLDITSLIIASALSVHAFADSVKWGAGGVVSPPPPPPQMNDSQNTVPDCSRGNTDSRCRPLPPQPDYRPQPHPYYQRPRPVIINQLPAQPAIEIDSLTDDWDGCRKAKLGSIRARNSGSADEANTLDEWLWKNCRSYSYELRQLEQDDT